MSSATQPISSGRLQTIVLILLAAVLSTLILRTLASILQPFFLAVFLFYFGIPIRLLLQKMGLPVRAARILVPVAVLLLAGLTVLVIWINAVTLIERFPFYQMRVEELMHQGIAWADERFPMARSWITDLDIPWQSVASYAGRSLGSVFGFVGAGFVIAFYMIFLALEARTLPERLEHALGNRRHAEIKRVTDSINRAVLAYIRIKTVLSLLATAPCALFMAFFGVDLWIFWSFLLFVGNFIPYLGSLVALTFPIAIFFLQSGDPWQTLILGTLLVGTKNLIEAVVEPKMAGRALNVSPLLVLLAFAYWAWLWGVIGMILAVPILVAMRIVLESRPSTRPLGKLMGERVD